MLPSTVASYAAREATHFDRLVYIGTTVPVRLWTGDGPFKTPGDDVLDPGALYRGDGTLVTVPPVRRLSGGVSEDVTFEFFGGDADCRQWLDDPLSDIEGAFLSYGTVFFDERLKTAGLIWTATYIVGQVSEAFDETQTKIVLTASATEAKRKMVEGATFSDAVHRTDHPTDNMFKFLANYASGTSPVWP